MTAFTSVSDVPQTPGASRITYWLYRPGLGWARTVRIVSAAKTDALATTPLLNDVNPRLVPLETLAGRNHFDFPPTEEQPWRWRVPGRYQ